VASGLYPNEKKYVNVFLPFSVALFLGGALMAYFFVFPPVLNFFFGFSDWLGQEQRPRINDWMSFVLMLPLAFGISFQLPLVMLFVERIGIVSVKSYISHWRYAVVGMAVAAMVLCPSGDPTSMLLMLIPMVLLYFGGIVLCKWMPAVNNPHAIERANR
jgi:sec-independent protein translocase protein TatC